MVQLEETCLQILGDNSTIIALPNYNITELINGDIVSLFCIAHENHIVCLLIKNGG